MKIFWTFLKHWMLINMLFCVQEIMLNHFGFGWKSYSLLGVCVILMVQNILLWNNVMLMCKAIKMLWQYKIQKCWQYTLKIPIKSKSNPSDIAVILLWPDCCYITVARRLLYYCAQTAVILLWPDGCYITVTGLLLYYCDQTAVILLWPDCCYITVARRLLYYCDQTAVILLWPDCCVTLELHFIHCYGWYLMLCIC